MSEYQHPSSLLKQTLYEDQVWQNLYHFLHAHVRGYVHRLSPPAWRGQEDDIVDDIVQEAIISTYCYAERAMRGEARPISSLELFSKPVAHHLCLDWQRKERRLARIECFDLLGDDNITAVADDPAEEVLEKLEIACFLAEVVPLIKKLPYKQRTTLLTDLANLAEEDDLLRIALLKADIELLDYRHPLPLDRLLRSRHAASLCIAYKRLRQILNDHYAA